MSAIFKLSRQVEFNHCDAAGIVFYPRYFEMIAAVQERFFADALGASWAEMTPAGLGTPMGEITVRFSNPSRLGDMLDFALVVPGSAPPPPGWTSPAIRAANCVSAATPPLSTPRSTPAAPCPGPPTCAPNS